MPYKFNQQIIQEGICKLFEGNSGYKNGEQKRDFVYVDDCVDVNLWFMNNPSKSGIFNVGTGRARTINEVANVVVAWHKKEKKLSDIGVKYIPFPNQLKGSYQNFTQADISKLRAVGYKKEFINIEEGIFKYLEKIN